MKSARRKIASGAVAALCLTLGGGLKAADPAYELKPRVETPTETKAMEGMPVKFNKASGIVGMEVRNHNEERLGHIRDVVFDLKSERVAYAVLGTGGRTIFSREKLLAVPIGAFLASADQKYLILRAEKSKVDTAMGLERHNWPSVTNPSWGAETFWEKHTEKPAAIEKPEQPPEAPPEAKPETKPEQSPEVSPEANPEIKPETKPEKN
jgi:sporulation protein YlmC with PRC-barrel domain